MVAVGAPASADGETAVPGTVGGSAVAAPLAGLCRLTGAHEVTSITATRTASNERSTVAG